MTEKPCIHESISIYDGKHRFKKCYREFVPINDHCKDCEFEKITDQGEAEQDHE